MNERFEWQDHDEVTTTYGSIQLAQQQAYEAGVSMGKRILLHLLTKERDTANRYYEDGLTYAVSLIERELNAG
jgi:hypothetical protein